MFCRGSYDLHFHHHNLFNTDEVKCKRVPWVPIDPTVLLPYHHKHGRIPATFEPEGKYKRVPCFKQYLFGNCNQVKL